MISLRIPSQRVKDESLRNCLEINVNNFRKVVLNNQKIVKGESREMFTEKRFSSVHFLRSSSVIVRENRRILSNQHSISPE